MQFKFGGWIHFGKYRLITINCSSKLRSASIVRFVIDIWASCCRLHDDVAWCGVVVDFETRRGLRSQTRPCCSACAVCVGVACWSRETTH